MMIRVEILNALRDLMNELDDDINAYKLRENYHASIACEKYRYKLKFLLEHAEARQPVTIEGLHQAVAISSPRATQ